MDLDERSKDESAQGKQPQDRAQRATAGPVGKTLGIFVSSFQSVLPESLLRDGRGNGEGSAKIEEKSLVPALLTTGWVPWLLQEGPRPTLPVGQDQDCSFSSWPPGGTAVPRKFLLKVAPQGPSP